MSTGSDVSRIETTPSTPIERLMALVRINLTPNHRQPPAYAVVVATVVSIVGSLVADAGLVVAGKALFPSTNGYVHFRFENYAKLTIIGVVIAGMAWPVVTRFSSAPRWLFLRLAVAVTVVLLLPDIWLLLKHESFDAVLVLMCMHLAIAAVTYNALVHIAPVRQWRKPQ